MAMQEYSTIVARIGRHAADDLDDLLSGFDARAHVAGAEVFPEIDAVLMPHTLFKRTDTVCVGFLIRGTLDNATDQAMRIAAMALERDVEVIGLSVGEPSGLERFGFHTERIAGQSEAAFAACVDQARRFWNLDLVI